MTKQTVEFFDQFNLNSIVATVEDGKAQFNWNGKPCERKIRTAKGNMIIVFDRIEYTAPVVDQQPVEPEQPAFVTKEQIQTIMNHVESAFIENGVKISNMKVESFDQPWKNNIECVSACFICGNEQDIFIENTAEGIAKIHVPPYNSDSYVSLENLESYLIGFWIPQCKDMIATVKNYDVFNPNDYEGEKHTKIGIEINDENGKFVSLVTVDIRNGVVKADGLVDRENGHMLDYITNRERALAERVALNWFKLNKDQINRKVANMGTYFVKSFECEKEYKAKESDPIIEIMHKRPNGKFMWRKLIRVDRNNTKYWQIFNAPCDRCGGMGGADAWKPTGWTCYRCGGSGVEPDDVFTKEFTPEHQAKLDAAREKRGEKKHKEITESRKQELANNYPENKIFIILGNTYEIKDQIKRDGGKYNPVHGWFFGKPVDGYDLQPVELNDAFEFDADGLPNFNFPKKCIASKPPKPISNYVGSVGEKIECIATYEFNASFGTRYGECTIYSFRDENGNVLIWRTTGAGLVVENENNQQTHVERGTKLLIKGRISQHREYNRTKQTELQRVSFKIIE